MAKFREIGIAVYVDFDVLYDGSVCRLFSI